MSDPGSGESPPADEDPQYAKYVPDQAAQSPDHPAVEDDWPPSTFAPFRTDASRAAPYWPPGDPYAEEEDPESFTPPPRNEPDDDSPPTRTTRMVNHMAFYVVVLSIMPALMWSAYASVTPDVQWVYLWPAIVFTAFGALTVFLRYKRGSVLEARRKMRDFLRNDQINGITCTNRMAQHVHQGEQVQWESRLHQVSVLVGGFGRMQSKWRRSVAVAIGLAIVVQAVHTHNNAWYLLLPAALAGYIGILFFEWSRDTYGISNKRIMGVTGLFTDKLATMPLGMTDFTSTAPWHSKLLEWLRWIKLAYANWNVESAGQDQALKYIDYVPAGNLVAAVHGLG